MQLTLQQAEAFAHMPLTYLRQEYPNHLMHALNDDSDAKTPRELHPVFYGCFDWHSAVHGFWLLLRCTRRYPALSVQAEIVELFQQHFTADKMTQELAYFNAPNRTPFERPYGLAWLLALDQELAQSPLPGAADWRLAMQPLTQALRQRLLDYLAHLSYPVRVGTHYNTAFALVLALDYARQQQDSQLASTIERVAQQYFGNDKQYPAHYEPNGDDYLSGALTEALLMSKVFKSETFTGWFEQFLPDVGEVKQLMQPAFVSDRTDAKIAHLDGLNLSRAWCMGQILLQLPAQHPAGAALAAAAQRHLDAAIDHVVGSHYSGGHWLASFALLALQA